MNEEREFSVQEVYGLNDKAYAAYIQLTQVRADIELLNQNYFNLLLKYRNVGKPPDEGEPEESVEQIMKEEKYYEKLLTVISNKIDKLKRDEDRWSTALKEEIEIKGNTVCLV